MIARQSKAMRESWLSWSSLAMLAFEAVCITPMATYAFRFYPDWSMLYLLDPEIFPRFPYWVGWLSIFVVALNFLTVTAAYLITREAILREKLNIALATIITGASSFILILLIFHKRIFFVGDYEAFLAGEAQLIIKTIVGISGIVVCCLGVGFVSWLGQRFSERDPKIF